MPSNSSGAFRVSRPRSACVALAIRARRDMCLQSTRTSRQSSNRKIPLLRHEFRKRYSLLSQVKQIASQASGANVEAVVSVDRRAVLNAGVVTDAHAGSLLYSHGIMKK